MTHQKAVIIGGGLGGLSAAIRLASQSYSVTLIDKNKEPGGKLHKVQIGNHMFDFGPNTITMPHVFTNVLSDAGLNPDDYFTFERLDSHTKNVFSDGSSLMFHADETKMKTELAKWDPESASRYPVYLKEVRKLYHLANSHFFHRTFSSWTDYLSLPLTLGTMRARPLETMDHFHRKFFKDERIVAAFNRYATYIGSSPYQTPATFGLIGHLEMEQGVFYAKGGNHTIADGLTQAAKDLGVEIRTDTEISSSSLSGGALTAVHSTDGEQFNGDVFILNGDLLTQADRIIHGNPGKKVNRTEPSVSAFVIMAAVDTRFDLHHHHVFFGKDPKAEFEAIFQHQTYSEDPTIYICTSSKSDPEISPDGDNLFILVNAPPLQKDGTLAEPPDITEARIFQRLKDKGIDIAPHLIDKKVVSPADIHSRFHAFRGALYGIASNRHQDTFLRPFNRSKEVSNLYFAGGSTHPGGGSPMVVLSGKNVADLIKKEHPSS
ncbi:phytoene desaturase family protein [Salisediminibacterium selenitireducens]|uniref:4,4'-diaponeurosporene oxygenase n=1 Tax=Bacillus selenitireducens (strain ATCC 700615 / DSM 15326 / MLS10) TaxID=439292 RepID=D6XVH8_BACIE|nr:phytoene desaturase family protein [Salisediminibacterium selenitireducens]ADH99716.1 phytoene desaturase [[Bacillus] selenitireducens MLS10]